MWRPRDRDRRRLGAALLRLGIVLGDGFAVQLNGLPAVVSGHRGSRRLGWTGHTSAILSGPAITRR